MTVESPAPRPATSDTSSLLTIEGLTKDFPGLRALDAVDLEVRSGEVVAVVGHNGSGKSTLVKILAGVYTADGGTVEFAEHGGLQTELHIIHQDLGLIAPLTAIENLGLNRDRGGAAVAPFNVKRERERARRLIGRFGEAFDVDVPIATLAPAQRSIIAIARALDGWAHERNVLILDEPTEALHASEVRILFDAVKKVAAAGAGVIFISHRLDEVLDLADRVVVLRDGRKVADEARAGIDHDTLVSYVTGVPVGEGESGRTGRERGDVVLEVAGLTGAGIESVDLTLHAGEVVGVAGVLGSGREALPALLFGSAESTAESFTLGGRSYDRRVPAESIRRGMGFVAGDRGRLGAVRPMNARENITLPELRSLRTALGALDGRKERAEADALITAYDVKPPRAEQTFAQFSGGNQQKIVMAKWLRNRPSVLLLEEPTQGVDIGAKQAIYGAIDQAAGQGAGVLVCSSEAKELVRLCDRVLVLRDGRVVVELSGEQLTEARLVLEGHGLSEHADASADRGHQ
ncbi:sugar ABC transporter ATP-binding protein [Agromyces aerolatus]|uniref:sugar ABC transporter ATP-binding protein n=1 Tax=Agromyces sp. LY-1074 TaxID=3074080 RepID=UPI0028575DCC|nr:MULTISPECIES: sugar ABC transporter ATP-binding protein [unclassified Agromyces]MDR5698688.1 sugar ABC transporter ATP-binding protein [Agromyces sp. LY-1074]MDR5704982.1 sugar ABC transporter ATP-binding protein [Agromyces sp. LY-1358]